MKVELKYQVTVAERVHKISLECMDLDIAWKNLKSVCELNNLPIPTEEDYKAGILTKTIIQE